MSAARAGRATRAASAGGVPARRAIARWAWRLFRREWRQQILVLALLTVAVAAAISGATLAYQLGPLGHTARFGAANQLYRFDGADPEPLEANVAALQERFGTIDVLRSRFELVPGTDELVEFRAQDPQGAYGAQMLALREGRYPTGAGEVAVTDAVATTFDLALDSTFALAGSERTVVGLVENPRNLRDEFALVAPSDAAVPTTVSVLVLDPQPHHDLPGVQESTYSHEMADQDIDDQQLMMAAAAMAAAAVAMILVSLVASAGFVVLAQRRQRQLGMLAAVGATQKHLRLVMLANGAVVGAVAAVIGTAVALLVWIAAAPAVEPAFGARIDRSDLLPWWLVVAAMVLTVAAATVGAWWPARAVARMPIIHALSGRPAPPRPVRRSAAVAGVLIAAGVGGLVLAPPTNQLLVGGATLATVLGTLALSPLALRTLAGSAGRLPVAVRLALRDLARYQARSAAALAAVSLALGIAATVIITTTAAERSRDVGNLPDSQLLITEEGTRIREVVTLRTPEQVELLRAWVNRLAAPLDDPQVIALEMAVDPDEVAKPGRGGMRNAFQQAVVLGDGAQTAAPGPLFVATPQLLELNGVDPGSVDADTEVLTVRPGEVGLRLGIEEELVSRVERLEVPGYSAGPTSLITPEAMRRRGWVPAFAGWLVEAGQPLTSSQIAQIHRTAASAGLMVMVRDGVNLAQLRALRSGGMAVGMLVALAILGLTVGLIRSQAAGDVRTLTASGATSTIRRTLTAATAGALAALGVALGTAGAYLGLATGSLTELDSLVPPPLLQLLVVAAGVPLLAAAAGWLLAGRAPPGLARPTVE